MFAILSAVFITLFQFLILYLVTTFDTQAMLSVILQQMPPAMKAFLQDSFFSMLTLDGAAAFGFNHPIVLTLLVLNAIIIPGHHITNELESGTLELLLAHPFKRSSLIFSLWLTGSMILLFIILISLTGSLTSILLFHELESDVFFRLLEICFNLWLLMILIFTFTLLVAVLSKVGVKASSMSYGLTFFFYLLYFLAEMWEKIAFTRPFNIFSYYEPQKVMLSGANYLLDIIVLTGLIIISFGISLRQFSRRDIP
jgi:ABC-type transport system involved in multi-copper enzyme maturation permease subunit